ncbi:MAG: universal stress protein [Comamonadaceae bacterium]|nr:universal stress protein [Comamonadaceae bacterium]
MTIKYVLTVATFSQASENAVERAAEIAARHQALLYVVHRPAGDADQPSDYHHRLALRAAQLGRRHGVEVAHPELSEVQLLALLEEGAQQLVMVLDRDTARRPLAEPGLLRGLAALLFGRRSLLDVRACPTLVVNRPAGEGGRMALLPYGTARDAERSVALARQLAQGGAREMFFVGPQRARPAGPEAPGRSEWPPPGPQDGGTERVVHSNYLSTRLNRSVLAFNTASTALRIRNQANFSGADLVIAPYRPPTLMERLLRRSLRERLTRELSCDLAFLSDPERERGSYERLARRGRASLLALAASKENRHG